MKIDLVFVTYNRLPYTKLSLPSLLADPTEEFSLTIWDNASTDGTQEYLSSVKDPRIVRKIFSRTNVNLSGAAKEIYTKSNADLVECVPNDFFYMPGWTRILAQAHEDVPEFGVISCWHLGQEVFDESRARHKIQSFGKHRVLRHPWTDGCGLVKLKALKELGFEGQGGSYDGKQLALKGYVNGFYVPAIYVEHMDYPWSKYYAYKVEEGVASGATYMSRGINTLDEAKAWHRHVVHTLLEGPWDVKYYTGWRDIISRVKRRYNKIFGV